MYTTVYYDILAYTIIDYSVLSYVIIYNYIPCYTKDSLLVGLIEGQLL